MISPIRDLHTLLLQPHVHSPDLYSVYNVYSVPGMDQCQAPCPIIIIMDYNTILGLQLISYISLCTNFRIDL